MFASLIFAAFLNLAIMFRGDVAAVFFLRVKVQQPRSKLRAIYSGPELLNPGTLIRLDPFYLSNAEHSYESWISRPKMAEPYQAISWNDGMAAEVVCVSCHERKLEYKPFSTKLDAFFTCKFLWNERTIWPGNDGVPNNKSLINSEATWSFSIYFGNSTTRVSWNFRNQSVNLIIQSRNRILMNI